MTQDNEQYRPGFEAWAREEGYDLRRDGCGFYFHGPAAYAWRIWTASKREASTEPSAKPWAYALVRDGKVEGVERTIQCARMWVEADIVPLAPMAGALTDESKGQTK